VRADVTQLHVSAALGLVLRVSELINEVDVNERDAVIRRDRAFLLIFFFFILLFTKAIFALG
jgi:small neutral amino acid transporter SnatA (MarC family)